MGIESRNSRLPGSIHRRRPPSSMRAAIASGYIRIGGASPEGSAGRVPSFDMSKHRVDKLTKGGQKSAPLYIEEPDIIQNFNDKGDLGIIIQTRGLVFNEEGFVPQQQNPLAYVAKIRINNQEGYFAIGGPTQNSDALRMAIGNAGGSRQIVNVQVPRPYSPKGINSIATNDGFVIISIANN